MRQRSEALIPRTRNGWRTNLVVAQLAGVDVDISLHSCEPDKGTGSVIYCRAAGPARNRRAGLAALNWMIHVQEWGARELYLNTPTTDR